MYMYMYIIITHKPWHSIWLHQHKLQFEYSPKTTVTKNMYKAIICTVQDKNTCNLRGTCKEHTWTKRET